MTRFERFKKAYSESMKRFGFDFSQPQFYLVTTLIVVAVTAVIVSATIGVISAFTPPTPSRISFGSVGGADGPRYGSFGPLDNTVSNELAVPVLYGQLKLAGNVIWQSDPGQTVNRIIGLCEGQIQSITDVRANDNSINDSNTPGSSFTAYLGTQNQKADSRVPESLRPDLEFHNLAYAALTLQAGEVIKGGNPTITSVCKGTIVETWDGSAWTTAKTYSRNPAACVRDFIINSRYGLGFPKANLDDATFGSAYDYCEEIIAGTGSEPQDRYDKLLLHFDGPDASTSASNSAPEGVAVTLNGDAQIKTDISKFGGAALKLAGTGYVSVPNSQEFNFSQESMLTVDTYFYVEAFPGAMTLYSQYGAASNENFSISIGADKKLTVAIQMNGQNLVVLNGTTVLVTGQWYKFAYTKNGSAHTMYLDDEVEASGTGTSAGFPDTTSARIAIGAIFSYGAQSFNSFFVGRIDDFRVSKGVDRYTTINEDQTSQNRYRLDYVIDSQRPAQDVLNDMLATFAGFLVYSGSKIKLRCEKIEDITQYFGDGSTTAQNASFDPSNIVRDSMSWNFPSVDDRPNRMKIQWIDPSQNYVKVYTQVDDRIDQDERNIVITKEVSLLGITRYSQASRMAKLFMAKTKYASASVQFSARLESIHCEVGDVIAVTHQSAMWARKLMRISDMQESEDETIRFTCTEYNASIYDDRQGAAITVQQQPPGLNLYAPLSDVTGLSVREDNFFNADGTFVVNLLVEWTAIPEDQISRLSYHQIQYSDDGGVNYKDAGFASSDKTAFRVVLGNVQTDTTFTIRVRTVSDRGAESSGATTELLVSGKITAPTDVDDFAVEFSEDHLTFVWSAVDDIDLFGYEIRVGDINARWETAAIVATELLGTQYYSFSVTRGTLKYFIKAIDNTGNYSENAVSDVITITDIPQRNIVMNMDLFTRITHPDRHPLFGEVPPVYENNDLVRGGNAHQFNGANQFIEVPTSSAWQLGGGTGDFTLGAWVYFHNVGSARTIMSVSNGVGNQGWTLVYSTANGGLTFEVVNTSNVTIISWTNFWVPVVNTWYFIELVRDAGVFKFFFNGVMDFTVADTTQIPNFNSPLHIGMFGSGGAPMRGLIDEVRISNVARSSSSYSLNYLNFTFNNGLTYFPFIPDGSDDLLMHMDETSGPLVKDSSGNGRNGMVNNAPNWTTGIVGYWVERIVPYLTNDYNPDYNRQTLGPITFYSFITFENGGYTFQQVQDNFGIVFGQERYYGAESIYQSAPIQISGSVSTSTYKLDLQSASTDNLGFFVPYIATSEDGITYSAFTPFVNGQYTAKFIKLQFRMQAMTSTSIVRLVSAKLVVDAPDRAIKMQNEAVSAGGRTFTLSGFSAVTSVILTVVGTSPLIPRIQDQSNLPNSFDVRLTDVAGTPAAGNVNVRVEGY